MVTNLWLKRKELPVPNLIDKVYIASLVPDFTLNMPDKNINPHIKDAEIFDFMSKMPPTFYSALSGTRGTELDALFQDYIKPLLGYLSHSRFLLYAGKNFTQFGAVRINEPTSQQLTAQEVSDIANDTNMKAEVCWTKLFNKLKADNYTYDTTTFDFKDYLRSTDSNARTYHIRGVRRKRT